MKKIIFVLTVCCLSLQASAQTQQNSDARKEPANPAGAPQNVGREPLKAIPDEIFNREFKDLDGRSFFLSNYRGQVFVLNIWASWCGPCRMQIPELNKLYEDYSKRGVAFIGLTTESPTKDAKTVRAFVEKSKMKYKNGWIRSESAMMLLTGKFPSIPQTYLVAADGRVVVHLVGFTQTLSQILRDGLEKALNSSPSQ